VSGDSRSPWWSSGAEDLDDATDPLTAHRSARSGVDQDHNSDDHPDQTQNPDAGSWDDRPWDVPWEDWDDRDPAPPPGAQRSTVEDAVDAVQALARFVAARSRGRTGGVRPHGREQTCRACPWCIAVRSLGDVRPEVVDHLDEALRHLVAAARAWVEAAESRGAWESIELDDEPDRG
jgi:hypothetical protein